MEQADSESLLPELEKKLRKKARNTNCMAVELGMERARLIMEDKRKGYKAAHKSWWTCANEEFKKPRPDMSVRITDHQVDDCEWYSKDKEKDTYFCYTNTNRRTMAKGEQAFNCYGNYCNRTLMYSYGFCLQDNKFESITIFLVVTDTTAKTDIDEVVRFLPPYRKKMQC